MLRSHSTLPMLHPTASPAPTSPPLPFSFYFSFSLPPLCYHMDNLSPSLCNADAPSCQACHAPLLYTHDPGPSAAAMHALHLEWGPFRIPHGSTWKHLAVCGADVAPPT